MQQKINILYIGLHTAIRELVIRLINQNEAWNGTGAATEAEIVACMQCLKPELVLLGNGLSPAQEARVSALLTSANPAIKIIQHYGGGSGLLSSEILEALSRKPITGPGN